jgi:hypothetical protein
MLFLQQPIGLLYAATLLKQRGYEASILDLRVPGAPTIQEMLARDGIPDLAVVTTSTYDLTQCYPWNLNTARQAVAQLRERCPEVFVVGAQGTLSPELTLKDTRAGGVLAGEVELVIPQFVDHLQAGASPLPELFQATGSLDLAQLPVPDFDMLPVTEYNSYVPFDTQSLYLVPSGLLFANRGCPFSCSYCYTGFFGGTQLRLRPVDLVIEEFIALLKRGVSHFFFLDYTFTVHKKWLNEFLTRMTEADLPVRWGCQTRVNVIDPRTLHRMAQAGCQYVWYGIESPFIASLKQAKPISTQQIERAIQWTIEADIVPMAFLLVGFSDEDIQSMIAWVASQPFIFSVDPLLPRYGTELFERTHVPMTDLQSWADLTLAATALEPNQKLVEAALEEIKQLPNFFANRLVHGESLPLIRSDVLQLRPRSVLTSGRL